MPIPMKNPEFKNQKPTKVHLRQLLSPSLPLLIPTQQRAKGVFRVLKRINYPLFSLSLSPRLPLSLSSIPTPYPQFPPKTPCAPIPTQNKVELHFHFIKQHRAPTKWNCTSTLFVAPTRRHQSGLGSPKTFMHPRASMTMQCGTGRVS